MTDPDFVIPYEGLPEGFAEAVDREPTKPVTPRPAATIVLLRPAAGHGTQVLLLRRVRSSGFVPGAYVFPGGRVDRDDAHPDLVNAIVGLDASRAAERLGLSDTASPPALAYYLASVREAFEETGILVARDRNGGRAPTAAEDPIVKQARDELLENDDAFARLLGQLEMDVDGSAIAYVAHWITPVAEPRRYDTRFFAAEVPEGSPVLLNPAEMSHHVWVEPGQALEMNRAGELPMVFPTIRTLEDLVGFERPSDVLHHFEGRRIPAWLPRLVRTPRGVGIEIDE